MSVRSSCVLPLRVEKQPFDDANRRSVQGPLRSSTPSFRVTALQRSGRSGGVAVKVVANAGDARFAAM